MKNSFRLIMISPEIDRADETAIVRALFNSGLEIYHLRKPQWEMDKVENFLEALPSAFHHRVVLHSHFSLTDKFKVKGIHLNEANKKSITDYNPYKIISASFHSLEDLVKNAFPYEYVFLSPVFDSISKSGYNSSFDLISLPAQIKAIKDEHLTLPEIIAMGGINKENIEEVKQLGFSGAAVLGSVWMSEEPVKEFQKIQSVAAQL